MPTIHIRVSEDLLADLDGRAAEEGRTRAAMAERLLAGSLGTVAKRLPRITGGRIEKKKLTDLVESGEVQAADVLEKRVRRTAMCPHGREYQHCTMLVCKQALAGPDAGEDA
jgi:hypothetical protein